MMIYFAYIAAAMIGLICGSFYCATNARVLYFYYGPGRKHAHRFRNFLTQRSFCMTCLSTLRPIEMIPLFSYFRSGGKCSSCRAPIGRLVPWMEIIPALLLPLLLAAGYSWPAALCGTLICGHLYIAAHTDYYFYQLDHENTIFIAILALLGVAAKSNGDWHQALPYLLSGFGTLLIFILLLLLSRFKGLGFGDVILAPLLALYIGFPWVLIMTQIAAAGSILHVFLIEKDRKHPAPLGTYLSIGMIATLFLDAAWRIFYDRAGIIRPL